MALVVRESAEDKATRNWEEGLAQEFALLLLTESEWWL